MRNSIMWLTAALLAAAVIGGGLVAQPPPDRGRPGGPGGPGGPLVRVLDDLNLPEAKRDAAQAAVRAHQDNLARLTDLTAAGLLLKMKENLSAEEFKALKEATDKLRVGPGGGRRLTTDDIVERIMSFDKNKDGKITKDELPERMQFLIEKGDTNKDGALDKEEIKKLAAELAKDGSFDGGAGQGGPGGRGGRGGPNGPGSGLTLVMIERAADDLKLSDGKKETVAAAIKSHKEEARKLTELARAELLLQVGDLLSDEELKKFKSALDRAPSVGERPGGGRGGPPDRGRPPRP
jgi:hypothetical protein